MNYFTFDGIDSRTYNTYIATSNAFDAPGREDEVIKVPGSNNIYYLTEGTYKPFDIKLYCYIPSNMQVKTDDLRNFLLSKGTCTYTEAIRPNEFRVARFIEAYELDVSDRVSAAFVLTFKAQPQRYLTTNTPITTTATADTTTDTTMSLNTVPTPLNIALNGNTTQEGSSGKNLLPIEAHVGLPYNPSAGTAISPTAKPTQWANNGDGTFKMTLTSWEQASLVTAPLTAGRYVARVTTVTAGMRVGIYVVNADGTANRVSAVKNGTTANEAFQVTTTLTAGQYFAFYIAGGSGECTIKEPMVEAGSTATAYEPHISPTNPQPIHNVSGDNEIKVTGKNILSPFVIGIVLNTTNGTESASVYGATTDFIHVDFSAHPSYYISGLSLTIHSYICAYNSQRQFLGRTPSTFRDGQSLTTSSFTAGTAQGTGDIAYLRVCYYQQGTDTDVSTANNYLTQLEVGNSRTDFEPYTRQRYPLYLPVENLLDSDLLLQASGWTENNGVYYGANSTLHTKWGTNTNGIYNTFAQGYYYTFSFDLLQEDITLRNSLIVRFYYSDNTYDEKICTNNTSDFVNYSITNNSTTKTLTKLILSFGVTNNIYLKKVQLEKGVNANIYNPYGNPYIELNGIGTYQDYIYKNGGKWYLHKAIKKVTLDGTENWASDSRGLYLETNDMARTNNYIGNMLCDKLTVYSGATQTDFTSQTYGITGWNLSSYPNQNWIYVRANNETTPAGFKTWLSSNHLLVYYQLKTPTDTEITDTTLINQLNNIEKAYSYNGTTNILQVSNDNGFMLEVVSLHSNNVSSNYKGEPIITVNSTGLIYFNGCVIKVNQAPMTINSQTMQAYNGTVNLNNYIEANDFPMIEPGNNVIGSEMPLSIVPNYWKL